MGATHQTVSDVLLSIKGTHLGDAMPKKPKLVIFILFSYVKKNFF